jgi:hypothetical protein
MHGDVPQQCLAIWFEVVCTCVASSMITCPRELVVLDVKKRCTWLPTQFVQDL